MVNLVSLLSGFVFSVLFLLISNLEHAAFMCFSSNVRYLTIDFYILAMLPRF